MDEADSLDDEVIERAAHEGRSMDFGDFFGYVERFHDDGRPGVDRDVLAAYAERLDDRRDYRFDVDAFLERVDEQTVASETWVGPDHFYALSDDRVSKYPARWHGALGGSTDVTEYLRFFRDEAPEFVADTNKQGAGSGVPEDELTYVVEVLGRVDGETAREALAEARDEGVVVEDNDQHPQTDVYLAEGHEDRRDGALGE